MAKRITSAAKACSAKSELLFALEDKTGEEPIDQPLSDQHEHKGQDDQSADSITRCKASRVWSLASKPHWP